MKPLWQSYGLFSLSGSAGRLGGGKKDLSMLFVYTGVDQYLRTGGKLGFVITQTVFKTKGAGDGFRRFAYERDHDRVVLRPLTVHDLSEMQVFEGATNRTAVFVGEKSEEDFEYPVRYVKWTGPSRIDQDDALKAVMRATARSDLDALPVEDAKPTSPWLTTPHRALAGIRKVMGRSDYKAYEGVNTGGLNACYWVQITGKTPDGNLVVENLSDIGKIKVEHIRAVIEPDLVYPLLRGRDVSRWRAEPSAWIILAQDVNAGKGIPEQEMKKKWPRTYAYLKRFEGDGSRPERGTLRGRALYKQYFRPTDPFYSMYNVGPYSLAPWKVYWTRVATTIGAAVVGSPSGGKVVLSVETATFVPFQNAQEAHYFAALMNSSPCRCVIENYSSKSTGSFGSPHVVTNVGIPTYRMSDSVFRRLSELSNRCHAAKEGGDLDSVSAIERDIDRAAAKLWGITDDELKAIQDALAGTGRSRRGEAEGSEGL